MKTFVLLLVLFCGLSLTSSNENTKVYLCNGSASTKYHLNPKCRGLERCTTKLDTVTLKQAKEKGRTLCGYEKR